jgi:hypothetical protein
VDGHQTRSAVAGEMPARLERKQDLRHIGSAKQSDLAMTLTRLVVLTPELREGVGQRKDVGRAGKPL